MPAAAWTEQDLTEIERNDELSVALRRADGTLTKPRVVWAVRVGDEVYIRSVRGASGAWYRTTRTSYEGHVNIGAVDSDVAFDDVEHDPAFEDRIDAAYRSKYRRYTGPVATITGEEARATTLRLSPR
jgi:hypothetical protein